MLITKITNQKKNKNRYSIQVDGQYLFSASDETVYKFGLKAELEISAKELDKILEFDKKHYGMQSAFRLLSYRARSKKELQDRLKQKDINDKTIKEISNRLGELGYLNDAKFAQSMANYRKEQGKGVDFIRNELKQKGIAPQIASEVISALYSSREEELDQIKNIAIRKLKTMKGPASEASNKKLISFLSRRGFPIDKVFRVLKELRKDVDMADIDQ